MIQETEEEGTLAERMREVRARGHRDAYELKLGVDRLSDWREHVRSHPLPAVAVGAVAGFLTIRTIFPGPQPVKKSSRKVKEDGVDSGTEVAAKAGVASALTAMVGTMLANAARQYMTQQLQSRFRGRQP